MQLLRKLVNTDSQSQRFQSREWGGPDHTVRQADHTQKGSLTFFCVIVLSAAAPPVEDKAEGKVAGGGEQSLGNLGYLLHTAVE